MAMETSVCSSCQKPKAALKCGICDCSLCKNCAQFMDSDRVSFLKKIPAELGHNTYCEPCFHNKVTPRLEAYDALMERAKGIFVYLKHQRKECMFIKRTEDPLKVTDCNDHNETILRLAFFAAEQNYNVLIDVDVTSEKIRNGSYQTLKWSGTAVPAVADLERLNRKSILT
jgi:hypothetical protein